MKESSQTDVRGQSYKHRRFFRPQSYFRFSQLQHAAFPPIPTLWGHTAGDCSEFGRTQTAQCPCPKSCPCKNLAITQPFLGQIASSWARWNEGMKLFPYSASFSKLLEKWRRNGRAIVQMYKLTKLTKRLRRRILRHNAAISVPISIFSSCMDRARCPLSNEPKIKQFGQETAELWPNSYLGKILGMGSLCAPNKVVKKTQEPRPNQQITGDYWPLID